MRRIFHPVLLAAAAAALAAPAARADTDGFAFGIGFHSNRVAAQDETVNAVPGSVFVEETGGGANLWLGWGVTRSFALRLLAAVAEHETSREGVTLAWGGATLEAIYLFRDPEPLRPYVAGGIGAYGTASRQDDLDFATTGPGVLVGAGILYSFGETWAMEAGLRGQFVNWKSTHAEARMPDGSRVVVERPIEDDDAALDLVFGVSWWL